MSIRMSINRKQTNKPSSKQKYYEKAISSFGSILVCRFEFEPLINSKPHIQPQTVGV